MTKKKYNKIEVSKDIVKDVEVEEVQQEKKPLKKVVSAEPKKVKRGLVGRLVSGIVGPDGVSGIGEYVNEEIIKPAIKNIIVDAVTSGINMIMYGEKGGRQGGSYRGGGYQRTNYQSSYRPSTPSTSRYTSQQPEPVEREVRRVSHRVEEFILKDRYDAAHVLTTLTEQADMYGSASVADYYDLIGAPSVFTDNDYGWTIDTITRATIVPVRNGYVIKFPAVEVI